MAAPTEDPKKASQEQTPPDAILPGACLGVIGGGQLGRMFAQSAKKMGYRVIVLTPEKESPASQVADETIVADYDDFEALEQLSKKAQAVTIEFENIPSQALEYLEARLPVRPGASVLHTTQHRLREKRFLKANGFATAPFEEISTLVELEEALDRLGTPAVLKTAGFGYDGKGQVKITSKDQAKEAFLALEAHAQSTGEAFAILEGWVDFVAEFSVIGVRGLLLDAQNNGQQDSQFVAYGPVENRHKNHILDITLSPCQSLLSDAQKNAAIKTAGRIAEALGVVGVLTVELFLTQEGHWLVNELAPRPHNSGHYTIDACNVSQFDQQVLALSAQPLITPEQQPAAIMLNLLGDWWFPPQAQLAQDQAGKAKEITPHWEALEKLPNTYLHLYGKKEARPGRKMGHVTFLDTTLEEALAAREAILNVTPTKAGMTE